ncbi:MAG TPA: radical SAM protein [Desulfobacteraceae bacterium]|nr:radical SAM protein [Desulfobacteraceae bacterium]
MRILLIKPPLNKNLLAPNKDEPLELEYVAAAAVGHDVEILDLRFEKDLWKKLGDFHPELVGVTAFTCDVRAASSILREVRKFDSRIRTVVGGHHATMLPEDFAHPFVDVIFRGMADDTFKQFVGLLAGGKDIRETPNIALVSEKGLTFTERRPFTGDLDLLPLPARHLTEKYRKHYRDSVGNTTGLMVSSRGCPYRCTFCACWRIMDGKYFTRSVEAVVDEFADMASRVDLICFADDNTLHDTKRAWRMVQLLRERGIKQRFMMYARTDLIVAHPDLMAALKEVGLDYLLVGIESFRDEELKKLNKKIAAETNIEAMQLLRKLGISVSPHMIVDPDFSKDDFRRLLKYIIKLELFRPVYTVLTPLPGTALYEENYARLAIRDYDFFDFTHSVLPTRLSRKEFYRQYAGLYNKSYSFRRYFRWKWKSLLNFWRKKGNYSPPAADRIPFFLLAVMRLFALRLYFKVRHVYKVEPLVKNAENQPTDLG